MVPGSPLLQAALFFHLKEQLVRLWRVLCEGFTALTPTIAPGITMLWGSAGPEGQDCKLIPAMQT